MGFNFWDVLQSLCILSLCFIKLKELNEQISCLGSLNKKFAGLLQVPCTGSGLSQKYHKALLHYSKKKSAGLPTLQRLVCTCQSWPTQGFRGSVVKKQEGGQVFWGRGRGEAAWSRARIQHLFENCSGQSWADWICAISKGAVDQSSPVGTAVLLSY